MSLFDFPAMVNYILDHSGSKSLSYVGHSMGCAILFAGLALKPELNSKINVMIALAPSVYGTHIRNTLARISVPVGNFLVRGLILWEMRIGGCKNSFILQGKLRNVYSREIFPYSLIAYAKKFLPYLTLNPERVGCWILKTFGTQTGVMGSQQIDMVCTHILDNLSFIPKNMELYFTDYSKLIL